MKTMRAKPLDSGGTLEPTRGNRLFQKASPGNFVTGFEIASMAASGNQTLNLSLADVLEFTSGNAVPRTLRITGNGGDVLNLQVAGKTLLTPAAGESVIDVDGTSYVATASTAGNASANEVSIGGATYDVYQYMTDSGLATLLVDTRVTVNPSFWSVAGGGTVNEDAGTASHPARGDSGHRRPVAGPGGV
jgi:hypothetical protein